MMLDCLVHVEDVVSPQYSFRRFVLCNLHLGVSNCEKQISKQPYLVVVTRHKTLVYKIFNNIKRIVDKELNKGKISVSLRCPSHCVLINCNNGKLPVFLQLLRKLTDKNKFNNLKGMPTIADPTKLKFSSKSRVSACIQNSSTNVASLRTTVLEKITCIKLREQLRNNLQELDLPNSNIKNLPIQLGQIFWIEINLEGNYLSNEDLIFLEELPVRKSLRKLSLQNNKITLFPPALVDCYHLNWLNLRNNSIQYIPGTLGDLNCLRYLDLSENEIRYLPASILHLKLNELNLCHNYLTSNIPNSYDPGSPIFNTPATFQDLSALYLNSSQRRQLTSKDCPRTLLDKLRCSSRCICEKSSNVRIETEFFLILNSVTFSASCCIHPQKSKNSECAYMFLQYHFCNSYKCESLVRRRFALNSAYFRLRTE